LLSYTCISSFSYPQDDGNLVAKDKNRVAYWDTQSGPGKGVGPFVLKVGRRRIR
jgi:hypothetical protein